MNALERELEIARERNRKRLGAKIVMKAEPRWRYETSPAQVARMIERADPRPARLPCDTLVISLNPDAHRLRTGNRKDLKRFGLTQESWEKLVADHDSCCAICGKRETYPSALAIDHCHHSTRVRGLLCRRCNTGLGQFNDDPEMLAKAMRYLARTSSS